MFEDLTGQVLGPYRLEELIGRGGMATVYRAHQTSMQRDVAIKVMAPHLAGSPEFVARFEREARVIARLQHPHILPVIDFGQADGYIYLVMRLVQGGVLGDKLRQPLSLSQVARFLEQIASALEYAHKQGVVHRDLKPTNVLLDKEDNVYLTDFGIAKMIAGTTTGMSLTATGNVMGTPAYMAPEQWRSEPVDARTDIYALGIMLYEMLLGALPFQSDTPFGLMYKHFDQPPPPPRVLHPDLPLAVEQVVLRALAKQPDARYSSAQQMAADFAEALRPLSAEKLAAPLPRVTQDEIARATPPAGSTRPTVAPEAPTVPPPTVAEDVPLPADVVPPEAATGYQPHMPPVPTSPQAAQSSARGGRAAIYGFFTVLLIAVLGGGAWWWWNGRGSSTPTPAMMHASALMPTTAPAIVILSSPSATNTTHRAETPRPSPSATPDWDATAAAHTASAWDQTAAWTDTPTPDLGATADAILVGRLTETAAAHTDTPTPDMRATVSAALTGTAAAWTDTPTPDMPATVVAALTGTASRWTNTPTSTRAPTLPPPPSATRTPRPTHTPRPTATATLSECGALPTRMRVGDGGRTTLDSPLPTALRAAPLLDGRILHTFPPGQTFVVVEGPECADGVRWWFVEGIDADGVWDGWIGEGQDDTYWIEPFEAGLPECPSAPPPRMRLGEPGRITLDPPLPSRVRSSPHVEADNVIARLEPGEAFVVLSGPVCDLERGWRWWLVENDRVYGWVAEGPIGEYWMEPLP